MTSSSSGTSSSRGARHAVPGLEDSLTADLRRLVSSSELHRLCAASASDRPAAPATSGQSCSMCSWPLGTETQQALAARDSSFARFNLSPEDVRQWRLEQQQLESFAAATRRQSHGTTAAESIGTQGRTWHTVARDPQRADPPLAAQGQHGLVVYAPLPGLSSQAHQVATSAPIESAANDLALLVANVRNPHRLRAIQNCLEDSQMSQGAAAPAQVAPDAQQLRAAQRRHKHRPDQKKVLRDWFDAHAIDPYPTTEEKAQLAQLAGMDVKQVENWFTNRRKRNWRHVKEDESQPQQTLPSGAVSSTPLLAFPPLQDENKRQRLG